MKSTLRTTAASFALVMLAACGSSTSTTTDTVASAAGVLSGICPETVTIQTDWHPESEHGFAYQLVGAGYEVDASGLRAQAVR